ncbi:MAG: aldolase/citrate lyase family protein [Burkholderiales bacterium]
MKTNIAKSKVSQGHVAIGTLCTTASALMAEALGHAGYDFVVVDLQHGENNLGNVQHMLQAVSATPAMPFVRVPANVPVYIQRALDLGAYGIVIPLLDDVQDAEAAVASVRYAPAGARSWGPVRGAMYGGPDYFDFAHEELVVLAMIETAAGLRNARRIMEVSGIDGCFIGPNDLAISIGERPEQRRWPDKVEEAITTILAATSAAGKASGIQCFGEEEARMRIDAGFRYVSVQSDLRMARAAATATLDVLRHQGGTA